LYSIISTLLTVFRTNTVAFVALRVKAKFSVLVLVVKATASAIARGFINTNPSTVCTLFMVNGIAVFLAKKAPRNVFNGVVPAAMSVVNTLVSFYPKIAAVISLFRINAITRVGQL